MIARISIQQVAMRAEAVLDSRELVIMLLLLQSIVNGVNVGLFQLTKKY